MSEREAQEVVSSDRQGAEVVSSDVRTVPAPITRQGALENAARVLRFAEGETNPMLAEHFMELASKWMELAETAGD